jgi:ribonuclease HI
MSEKIVIYTDGACSGNPGPGGWGAVLIYGDSEKHISGHESNTTNNKMELTAAIKALKALKDTQKEVILYTDSMYVKNGITEWITGWKKKGWKTTSGPVKNRELWEELDALNNSLLIEWRWVRGHSDSKYNNLADELARLAVSGTVKM